MAVTAIGARNTMTGWPEWINGLGIASLITAVGAWVVRRSEKRQAVDQTKLTTDVAWNTELLKESRLIRQQQGERIASLERHVSDSAEKLSKIEDRLHQEQRTVDRLMAENDYLRKVNEELRADNERLMGELNEERARNNRFEQKILALESLMADGDTQKGI